jgi:hypothetical protein
LEPGSLLVLQVHYNLLATDGRPSGTDQSSVRLRLIDGTAATEPLDTLQLMAPIELPCAPGESGPLCDRAAAVADVAERFGPEVGDVEAQLVNRCSDGTPVPGNTQHCDIPVPQPVTVYAAFGHMHLLGRSIKVEPNPGTPHVRTLLDVPSFDFDNQQLQPLSTPVDLLPGDTVRVTCTHDASACAAASAEQAPAALRGLGGRHQRRDVPGPADRHGRGLTRPDEDHAATSPQASISGVSLGGVEPGDEFSTWRQSYLTSATRQAERGHRTTRVP